MEIKRSLADAARTLAAKAEEVRSPARTRDDAYRLRRDEHIPDGVRRIARGQLDGAREDLGARSQRKLGAGVHSTRKRLKRLRTCLRLTRDALGEEAYERENAALRAAGRRLAPPRDAQVLLETLDALRERFADELPEDATARLREQLELERDAALAALIDGDGGGTDGAIAATRAALDEALARTPTWTFAGDGFDALAPGLRRIHRRARKAMRAAQEEPSPENLHTWRKRVKDLRHATQIVRCADPKQLDAVARRAHKLGDVLGKHHDLHVLRSYVVSHPRCFDGETSRQALIAVIDRRSSRLCEKALRRGAKLLRRKPKRFVREIERGWRKRAARAPKPQAG